MTDRCSLHQHVVYEVIAESDEVSPGDLYDVYRERDDDPKTERTVRNYCSKLEQYTLIRAEGQQRGRRYRLAARAPEP